MAALVGLPRQDPTHVREPHEMRYAFTLSSLARKLKNPICTSIITVSVAVK